jgi:hypothetical protein
MSTRDIPVGSKIRFRIGGSTIEGRVVEDRGPIGLGGRRLYHVRYELGEGNWYSIELPAVDFEVVDYRPVNRRKRREVDYIIPVETVEANVLFARPEHARPLAEFLRSHGVRLTEEPEAIQGRINLRIDKSTPWGKFVDLLNDWKQQYAAEEAKATNK